MLNINRVSDVTRAVERDGARIGLISVERRNGYTYYYAQLVDGSPANGVDGCNQFMDLKSAAKAIGKAFAK